MIARAELREGISSMPYWRSGQGGQVEEEEELGFTFSFELQQSPQSPVRYYRL